MKQSDTNPEYEARKRMVETQIRNRGVTSARVLEALTSVPRDRFLPRHIRDQAYADGAVPIGKGQTCSQPYIVAYMTEWAEIRTSDTVLEIGTGSGYQTAVLAELAREVYTIERIESLSSHAREILETLGYRNIHFFTGDGYDGVPDHAPYDAILVTAAAAVVPPPLFDQLADGGRLVCPVGDHHQRIVRVKKQYGKIFQENGIDVRFVPFVTDRQP
jgi:protein-L-isoaspartate(D-aspartate) O-methyltransferase